MWRAPGITIVTSFTRACAVARAAVKQRRIRRRRRVWSDSLIERARASDGKNGARERARALVGTTRTTTSRVLPGYKRHVGISASRFHEDLISASSRRGRRGEKENGDSGAGEHLPRCRIHSAPDGGSRRQSARGFRRRRRKKNPRTSSAIT